MHKTIRKGMSEFILHHSLTMSEEYHVLLNKANIIV